MKKIIALILCLTLVASWGNVAFASASQQEEETLTITIDLQKIIDFLRDIFPKIKEFFTKMKNKLIPNNFTGSDYTIPSLDLSVMPDEIKGTEYEYLYDITTVDNSNDYMAHPDSVLLKNGKIGLKELYNMDLPLKSKIKYTTLALFGATVHSRIYAALHKKLC